MTGAWKGESAEALDEVVKLAIRSNSDVVLARQKGRELAAQIGFPSSDIIVIAAAISEITRNIVDYAQQGELTLERIERNGRQGILVVARDEGPGIADVGEALQYGYSPRRGLGVGLPGAKWLMDEFNIVSKPGKGTTVTMKKWLA